MKLFLVLCLCLVFVDQICGQGGYIGRQRRPIKAGLHGGIHSPVAVHGGRKVVNQVLHGASATIDIGSGGAISRGDPFAHQAAEGLAREIVHVAGKELGVRPSLRRGVIHPKPIHPVHPIYPQPINPIHKPVHHPKRIVKPIHPKPIAPFRHQMHHKPVKSVLPIHPKPIYPQPVYPKQIHPKPIMPVHKPVHQIHPKPVMPIHRPVHQIHPKPMKPVHRPVHQIHPKPVIPVHQPVHLGGHGAFGKPLGGGSPVHNVHKVGKSGIVRQHHNPIAADIGHQSAKHLAGRASRTIDIATGGGVSHGDPFANQAALGLAREAARVTNEELALASGAAGPFLGGSGHIVRGHGQFVQPFQTGYGRRQRKVVAAKHW